MSVVRVVQVVQTGVGAKHEHSSIGSQSVFLAEQPEEQSAATDNQISAALSWMLSRKMGIYLTTPIVMAIRITKDPAAFRKVTILAILHNGTPQIEQQEQHKDAMAQGKGAHSMRHYVQLHIDQGKWHHLHDTVTRSADLKLLPDRDRPQDHTDQARTATARHHTGTEGIRMLLERDLPGGGAGAEQQQAVPHEAESELDSVAVAWNATSMDNDADMQWQHLSMPSTRHAPSMRPQLQA
ncbi:hypothetical protein ACLKA6_002483 [Drosophila palustris]